MRLSRGASGRFCAVYLLESIINLPLEVKHLLRYVLFDCTQLVQLLSILLIGMVHAVNDLLLLELVGTVQLKEFTLHVLVLKQFHAVLLVEVY